MKIIKFAVQGALVGLCIGLLLSFVLGCDATCDCAEECIDAALGCGNATCASGCQEYTDDPVVQNCIIYSTLICSVVGGIYGYFITRQEENAAEKALLLERSEAAKKQRVEWANELKRKALAVNNTCSSNKAATRPLVSTTYKANVEMTEIMNELTKVAEKQGKVDALAEELSKKGSVSV